MSSKFKNLSVNLKKYFPLGRIKPTDPPSSENFFAGDKLVLECQ